MILVRDFLTNQQILRLPSAPSLPTNARALAIYTACGFQITGERDSVLTMVKTHGKG